MASSHDKGSNGWMSEKLVRLFIVYETERQRHLFFYKPTVYYFVKNAKLFGLFSNTN